MLALVAFCLLGAARAQKADTSKGEQHPRVAIQHCTAAGCTAQQASVTLDSQWRQVLDPSTGTNCFEAGSWNQALCSDPSACASTCALAGLDMTDYATKYGVSQVNGGVQLKYVNEHNSIGSRLYLMETDDNYKMFRLKNREITFDVDVSKLPCGLNGAVYLVSMSENGGQGLGSNSAGAKYGTGYCDAQCPHDLHFISGEPNVLNWDSAKQTGHYGSCCGEVDLWEANSMANAYTMHPCTSTEPVRCEGAECGDADKNERFQGMCDKDGCDFNPYRMGDHSFFGPGLTVDTNQPMSVVTQFLTADGTDTGDLIEIKRFFVQNGQVIPNSESRIAGVQGSSITDSYCSAQKEAFVGSQHEQTVFNDFAKKGGLQQVGETLDRGMVLVLSLWDDAATHMDWLDATSPSDLSQATPGVLRGPCQTGSGEPEALRAQSPDATVAITNIRYGEIGSTKGASSVTANNVIIIHKPRLVIGFGWMMDWLKENAVAGIMIFLATVLLAALATCACVMLCCARRQRNGYQQAMLP